VRDEAGLRAIDIAGAMGAIDVVPLTRVR